MTRQPTPNVLVLGAIVLFVSFLDFSIALAQAQERGTDHLPADHSAASAPVLASTPRQALIRPPGPKRVSVAKMQATKFSYTAPDSGTSIFMPVVAYDSGQDLAMLLAVGDFNRDGIPDVAVVNSGGNVGVLLGNGDGTFQPVKTYVSGTQGTAGIAVADLNGDGILDLAVVELGGSLGGSVGVLLGNGDGTFRTGVTYADGGGDAFSGEGIYIPIIIADVNGDGKPDLIVIDETNTSYGDGQVAVLLGNGDGTFKPVVTYDTGGFSPFVSVLTDVNGDGKADVIVLNCGPIGSTDCSSIEGTVGVLLSNGDGTFQPVKTYSRGGGGLFPALVVADVNRDGKPDLIAGNGCPGNCTGDGSFAVLLGNGDGTFQAPVIYDVGRRQNVTSIAIGDLNGDGNLDLLVASDQAQVWLGSGDGTFLLMNVYSFGSPVFLIDLNNDGKLDFLGIGGTSNAAYAGLGNGDGTFQQMQTYALGGSQYSWAMVADINGDGRPDLLSANWCAVKCTNEEGTVGVLLNSTIPLNPTTTTFISSLNPSVFAQVVTFTAKVISSSGTPTGTVKILDGATTVGSGILSNGTVSIAVSSLSTGSHSMTAAYQGSGVFAPSTSAPLSQIVTVATTATSLTSSLNPAGTNQSVTFTATVTSQYGGAATGSVTFSSGSQTLGTASLSGNTAVLATSFSSAGTYSISAKYNGDGNNSASTSSTLSQVIIASTTTSLVSSLNPSVVGQAVTFTATVSSSSGVPPNGETITFKNGSSILGTSPLSGGTASLTTSSLAAGIYTITASYPGDANFAASTSPGLRQVVNSTTKSATATTLISSLNPSIYGQSVTWTATVTTSGSSSRPET